MFIVTERGRIGHGGGPRHPSTGTGARWRRRRRVPRPRPWALGGRRRPLGSREGTPRRPQGPRKQDYVFGHRRRPPGGPERGGENGGAVGHPRRHTGTARRRWRGFDDEQRPGVGGQTVRTGRDDAHAEGDAEFKDRATTGGDGARRRRGRERCTARKHEPDGERGRQWRKRRREPGLNSAERERAGGRKPAGVLGSRCARDYGRNR